MSRVPVPPTVLVLLVGDVAHGVTRYAHILARSMRSIGAVADEHEIADPSGRALLRAAWRGRGYGVVHVQLTKELWGRGLRQVLAVVLLRVLLFRRHLVVTAHDFHTPIAVKPSWRHPRRDPYLLAARYLISRADLVLVCSDHEADVVGSLGSRPVVVVPHYVEDFTGDRARVKLDRTTAGVLVVLGYIHPRKGQVQAVRAMAHLPGCRLVLAGRATPQNEGYLTSVLDEAAELGVRDRVEVTGWIDEDRLATILGSASAALVPYDRIAASGSISTLISAGVPMVAKAVPFVRQIAGACPTAVHTYDGTDVREIASAVLRLLEERRDVQAAELRAWAHEHSEAKTAQRHLDVYSTLTGARRQRGGEGR